MVKISYSNRFEIVYTYDAAGNRIAEQVINLNPLPTLSSLTPEGTLAGGQAFTLVVRGTNFINGSTVQWNGANRGTSFVSNTQLNAAITAADIATAGNASVSVLTPEPGGGAAGALTFKIQLQPNPAPIVASLSPDSIIAGAGMLALTVNGSNFVEGSRVRWNGSERATAFVSATKLTATITAADLAMVGMASVTVYSPAPGGGISGAVSFSIQPPPNGYEADLMPKASGNGLVDAADWLQAGRVVAGLETPANGNEFQRADSAPRATLGDSRLTLADWVQAGRYAAKLDPLAEAGGPTALAAAAPGEALRTQAWAAETEYAEQTRLVRAVNATFQRGQPGTLRIELESLGDENALAFSLNFDPQRVSFVDAKLSNAESGAALVVNSAQAVGGRIGIVMAQAAGQKFAAGTRSLLDLRFVPQGGDGEVTTQISFGDQVVTREVIDANALALAQTNYTNATVLMTGRALASVSAASYSGTELATEGIASAFGTDLAKSTEGATATPLPTALAGTVVKVRDSAGAERSSPLFFVSPSQVNYQIPPDTAEGIATITLTNRDGASYRGIAQISRTAPGLFSADASSRGLAAAQALRVKADNSQSYEPVSKFDSLQNKLVAMPIDLGPASDQVFLILYGTGIRHHSGLANVKATIGDVDVPVEYAGTQGGFVGLDQVNLRLPRSLAGRGEVTVMLTVDGKPANIVKVSIK